MDQSKYLGVDHLIIPLPAMCGNQDYVARVSAGLREIEARYSCSITLAFGDLHLQDLVDWRKASFPSYECCFPLFGVAYNVLLLKLFQQGVKVTVSSCSLEEKYGINVGDPYDQSLVARLPLECDVMGERGEFHTHVQFTD
jgi:diphthamide synthase (EF-2-diphthine--ammonia ligase)